jgi:2'-5' RNA ligase
MPAVGVAVSVPDPWGEQLRAHRLSFGDAQAGSIPTHITLLPPTDLSEGDLERVEKHLAGVAERMPAFPVHLRGTGTFRPVSPVVFVALASGISQVELLAAAVRSGPLDVPQAFPYHPHVTVAHDVPDAALDRAFTELVGFECAFEVSSFSLFRPDPGNGWVRCSSFELGTGDVTRG